MGFHLLIARRYTTTMLMMAYLASQLAAVPHAHGASCENQPSDHNARPHLHISCFDHESHSHDGGHTHHYECDECHSQPTPSDTNTGHDDHDSDAVYLPDDTGVSLPSKNVASTEDLQVVSTLVIAAIPTTMAISASLADASSPGTCTPACPLWLTLRALRI